MATCFRSMNPTVSRAFRAIGWDSPSFRFPDSMPDRWIVRQGMRYHLTPALCGRNRWKMEFSLVPVYGPAESAYAVGLSFVVKGHRAKSKAWRARRLARVTLLASLMPTKERI
jgi:hypothetical protein